MSDLIERLKYAAMNDHHGYPGLKVAGEAAGEIERLQTECGELWSRLDQTADFVHGLCFNDPPVDGALSQIWDMLKGPSMDANRGRPVNKQIATQTPEKVVSHLLRIASNLDQMENVDGRAFWRQDSEWVRAAARRLEPGRRSSDGEPEHG